MMLLFTTVVGVLLAGSYLAFWGLSVPRNSHSTQPPAGGKHLVPSLLTSITEPDSQDIKAAGHPGRVFSSCWMLPAAFFQYSKNLTTPIDFEWNEYRPSHVPVSELEPSESRKTVARRP